MKLGILSAMQGAAWGGSEELWAATAEAALWAKAYVSICLQRPMPDLPRLAALRKAGAMVAAGVARGGRRDDLAQRLAAVSFRLGAMARWRMSAEPAFYAGAHDVVLFNEGAAVPSFDNMERVQLLLPATPYVSLSHGQTHRILTERERRMAIGFFDRAVAALFVSEATLASTEKLLCHRLGNARVVRNPVNLPEMSGLAWPGQGPARMALVGQLDASVKGQDLLFECLGTEAWRGRDWVLSVYGNGPDAGYLAALAGFYGLSERIVFRGHSGDIAGVWRENEILLHPSRTESAPLSVMEAMLCGRPVVANAVGGLPEMVTDGQTGFLAPAATVGLLGDALERAWAMRGHWPSMGASARLAALARHDPDAGGTLLGILTQAALSRAA